MGIVRVVEWKLACSAQEADGRFRQAFTSLDLAPEGPPGSVKGTAKRAIKKNRWAAEVAVDLTSGAAGTVATCRVDMAGSKHFDLLDELADAVGADVLDDKGLDEAVGRLGKASRLFGRKEIRHVRYLLRADELVEELGQGQYTGKQGLVVLTSSRLFFLEKSLGSETVEDFPIAAISSMSLHKKMSGETLLVHAAGTKAEIKSMLHGQGDALIRAFWRVKQTADGAGATPPAAPDDAIAQLERLAGLRDQGVLSSEEFETKKIDLLRRI
ncbi:SHOCT domain-containing protein [Amycolatopsis sp. NBC_00345]|uniref:SHOCT domain-containing protein n=1 Tax=Amycolatopsis sp. NBC_00345 TaxID=2975955 RepID=UPI002E259119